MKRVIAALVCCLMLSGCGGEPEPASSGAVTKKTETEAVTLFAETTKETTVTTTEFKIEMDFFDADEVDAAIRSLQRNTVYLAADLEGRRALMEQLLKVLAVTGTEAAPYSLVRDDSIRYEKGHTQISFLYANGMVGNVQLAPEASETTTEDVDVNGGGWQS